MAPPCSFILGILITGPPKLSRDSPRNPQFETYDPLVRHDGPPKVSGRMIVLYTKHDNRILEGFEILENTSKKSSSGRVTLQPMGVPEAENARLDSKSRF